jgi:hypothetical protein
VSTKADLLAALAALTTANAAEGARLAALAGLVDAIVVSDDDAQTTLDQVNADFDALKAAKDAAIAVLEDPSTTDDEARRVARLALRDWTPTL